MSKPLRRLLLTVIAALYAFAIMSASAHAQVVSRPDASTVDNSTLSRESYDLDKGMNEYAVWGGGSFDSPTLIGTAKDRKFLMIGLRYGRIIGASKRIAYEYTVDAVPLALIFQPEFARAFNRNSDSTVYGAGISPVGFKVNFNRRGRVKPYASGSGGFLYFRRPVPVDIAGATRFNFTFDFGGGVQVFTHARRAVTLGYQFHHISNGGRSEVNPGLDANVFSIGFSFFK